jgi:soluble lytic murein transglycosylase-like protein
MRWLIALALIFAVVIIGPDFAGRGATPLAIWEAPGAQNFQLASLIPDLRKSVEPGATGSVMRKFYEDMGLVEEEPPLPELTKEEMCEHLASAADQTGIPAPFFARLLWQESRFDPRAVSPVGAQGVAQFMPKVAAAMGLEDPFDARAAIPTSAQLLRTLYRTFGNLGLAAAAYNAGPKRIQDWLARRGKLPDETRNYVLAITGHAPEKWTVESSLELPLDLPRRAPCDGIAGLSRAGGVATIPVRLDDSVVKLIDEARMKVAKAKVAKAQRALATARKANAAKAKVATGKSKAKPAVLATKSQDRIAPQKVVTATAR